MSDEIPTGRSRGGVARAQSLTPERRQEIGREAAAKRWANDLPQSTHEAPLNLAGQELSAAVLEDGRRLLLSKDFLTALGRPWKGSYKRTKYPNFIDANNLSPFITSDLDDVLEPVEFKTKRGQRAIGYRAELLAEVIDIYLRARAAGRLRGRQKEIADRAEVLSRGLMRLGIIGLVDEATGYQRERAADALAQILEAFIAKELQPWVKTFPDEFYEQMFRLRGLEFPKETVKRPQYFGHLTNDIIYKRLAPGVLAELKNSVPKLPSGRRKGAFAMKLTPELGHPRLREHLASVITIMSFCDDYREFQVKLDKRHPRYGETGFLDFNQDDNGSGL